MKKKTINLVIKNKVNEWLASIDNEVVRNLARRDVIVTGGCIASMLLKEKVNDFDIYFKTKDTTFEVAKYYLAKFKEKHNVNSLVNTNSYVENLDDRVSILIKSAGVASEESDKNQYSYFEMMQDSVGSEYVQNVVGGEVEDTYDEVNEKAQEIEDKSYRPVFLSTNAITLSNRIQIVTRFSGNAEQIHENFDFVHCTNYWTPNDGVVLNQKALEAILARELRYVGSKYPLCSILRMRKFIQRGWTINVGQILKAVVQLQDINLKDIDVLRDQLTGVDSSYFVQVINRLKEKGGESIDSAYLIEIVDRIF